MQAEVEMEEEYLPWADWSDESLLRHIQDSHEGPFRVLYERHVKWAWMWACEHVAPGDAWDIVQEAFLYLWKKIPDLIFPCRLQALLRKVIRNLSLNFIRKQKRCRLWDPAEFDLIEEENAVAGQLERLELWRHLEVSLSVHEFRVLTMRFRKGLTYALIAEVEGVPVWTIKRSLYGAVRKLKSSSRFSDAWGP